ncbi:MAG: hypothetical protein V4568_17030, partial [Pseudomonadota bacterium]
NAECRMQNAECRMQNAECINLSELQQSNCIIVSRFFWHQNSNLGQCNPLIGAINWGVEEQQQVQ